MSFNGDPHRLPEGLDIPVRMDAAPPEAFRAVQASTDDAGLTVELADGRLIVTQWHELGSLRHSQPTSRLRCEVLDNGSTIGFPDLDEFVSVPALLGFPD